MVEAFVNPQKWMQSPLPTADGREAKKCQRLGGGRGTMKGLLGKGTGGRRARGECCEGSHRRRALGGGGERGHSEER